jgi:hypothetical protein
MPRAAVVLPFPSPVKTHNNPLDNEILPWGHKTEKRANAARFSEFPSNFKDGDQSLESAFDSALGAALASVFDSVVVVSELPALVL